MSVATIYTVGHSTRPWLEFVDVLTAHSISCLVDVRAFPTSRRFPQFNREQMTGALPAAGIEYRWMRQLGGRRGKQMENSPNLGLRNEAFRNYADYMLSSSFQQAVANLVELALKKSTAVMCAEKVFFQCHRMLLSDYLMLHGHKVLHIEDARPPKAHRPTPEAQIVDGQVIYSAGTLFKDGVA
jgi:uncharacterized protein (DUF488 family)